jgi:hypothetical protein
MLRTGGVCGGPGSCDSREEVSQVEKYFRKLQKNGTELYVDGEKVSPSQAAAYAVREESQYMADYILGEQGKISQVRLDKVDLR